MHPEDQCLSKQDCLDSWTRKDQVEATWTKYLCQARQEYCVRETRTMELKLWRLIEWKRPQKWGIPLLALEGPLEGCPTFQPAKGGAWMKRTTVRTTGGPQPPKVGR